MNKKIQKIISLVSTVILMSSFVPNVSAAGALTNLSDATSREKVSVLSDHVLKFTTTANGVAAGQKIQVDFQAASTYSATTVTSSDMTVTWGPSTGIENILTLGGAAAGATWGVSASALQVVVTSATGVITANSKVIVTITNKVTNPSTPATYVNSVGVYTAGSVLVDTGKIADVVVADDQFTINATVDPSLSFGIDTTAMNLGVLNSSSPVTATSAQTSNAYVQLSVSTNAQAGYSVSIKDIGSATGPGLYNANSNFTIGSSNYTYGATQDLSAAAGYGLQATSATDTISAPYTSTGTTVGKIQKTTQTLSTYPSPASTNTINLISKARVTGATPAGAYIDTLTLIATANF